MDQASARTPIPLGTDEELIERYGFGWCHLLALALTEITGFPVRACTDQEMQSDGQFLRVLTHAWVEPAPGWCLDIHGCQEVSLVLSEYEHLWCFEIGSIAPDDLLELGGLPDQDEDWVHARQTARWVWERYQRGEPCGAPQP